MSIGLLVVLGSLWITSLVGNTHDPDQFRAELAMTRVLFILGFTVASAIATVYGVRQADKMVLGYGAVFLCIDVYTRFSSSSGTPCRNRFSLFRLARCHWWLGYFWSFPDGITSPTRSSNDRRTAEHRNLINNRPRENWSVNAGLLFCFFIGSINQSQSRPRIYEAVKIATRLAVGLVLSLCAISVINAQSFDVKTRTLKNGMKILVQEDKSIPNVALYIFYRIGSRNERPGTTVCRISLNT